MIILILFMTSSIMQSQGDLRNEYDHQHAIHELHLVVINIINEMRSKCDCMVIIMDHYHWHLFPAFFFQYSLIPPEYMVDLRDNEEFSPARDSVRTTLQRSKSAGCDAYVILIANGLLASRFVQYVEEEQLVNTRGLFLLLHDQRLFRPHLIYIWGRIINVVFVRRYNYYRLRAGKKMLEERIDLETVYYPPRAKRFLLTKYIDHWHQGQFRYGNDHFLPKTRDLRKKTLRVAVFEHIPAVSEASRSYYGKNWSQNNEALGIEFELMRVITKALNFKAHFYMPYDIAFERWGTENASNSYTGLIGEAINGKATFLLGDLHYTLRHLKFLDLTIPYNTECLTFLTPESLTENSWKLLLVPFKLYTWLALLFTLLVGGIVINALSLSYKRYMCSFTNTDSKNSAGYRKLQTKNNESMRGLYLFAEPQNGILYTYSMLLLVSLPRLPNAWAVRVFVGWWWIYSILVAVAYRASMTAALANPPNRITIDTLDQLAKSSISVGGWSEESKEFFLTSTDSDSQIIGNKFEIIQNEPEAIERIIMGDFGYYENAYLLRHIRAKRRFLEWQESENNSGSHESLTLKHNLHIMDECAVNMPIAIGMEKNSPLKPYVDIWIRRMIEVGLVEKWLSDIIEWSKIIEIRQESEPEKAVVNLHKLHGAFVALAIGYLFSLMILIGEIVYWKLVVLKDPKYDKYHLDVFYRNTAQTKKS